MSKKFENGIVNIEKTGERCGKFINKFFTSLCGIFVNLILFLIFGIIGFFHSFFKSLGTKQS